VCESLHNYFIMKSTSNYAVLLNFETKNVETHKFTSTIRTIQLRSGLSMVTMDVFICLDVSVTYNGTTGENQVIMTGICQSLVRIPKRTRQRAKTLNSILIFLFCAEKNPYRKCPSKTNLSEDLLPLIHAIFKRDFYIVSYSPEHNTTERTNPDFVYICKSNHTSHLLAHAQKKGDV
jgi:ribosomal protein S9